jgi:phage-related protein
MQQAIPWEFYVSDLGRPLVEREIKDFHLSHDEASKLEAAMDRVAASSSRPNDIESLGRGLWEVRVRFNHRLGRILFSSELGQNCNVVLFAGIKKAQKTPEAWLDLAIARRKSWRQRQISL